MRKKAVEFIASSLNDIRNFPKVARNRAGYQIDKVQDGEDPDNWKPMQTIGQGVKEIRIDESKQYRVVYIAKFQEAVYILHAFMKKTQKTPKKDIDIAKKRYKLLINERRQNNEN